VTEHTLLVPSSTYNPSHERLRNRRIEEVMRRMEINHGDQVRAMWIPAANVADIPTEVTAGVRGFAMDATANTFNAPLVGGGTNKVPVFFDGTIWRVG
jgi:hypothetical protein